MTEDSSDLGSLPSLRRRLFWIPAAAAFGIALWCWFRIDIPVARYFYSLTDPRVDEIAGWFSEAGTIIRPELALLSYFILRKRSPRWAAACLFFFVAVLAAGLVNVAFKIGLGRCRPELLFEEGRYGFTFFKTEAKYWSFPSGHTASAMAAMTVLTILLPRVGPIFLIQALLVAASRVALREHYVSDVLVGGIVGSAVTLVLYDGYFRALLAGNGWWARGEPPPPAVTRSDSP